MSSILISGANGFLGSNLSKFLLNRGDKVFGIYRGQHTESNIIKLHDDVVTIEKIPEEISCIVHFAAVTDIEYCEKNPEFCNRINVDGTKNILNLALKNNAKLIFASSSHVFGKPCYLPINEEHPLNPLSIHAKSKVEGEVLCETYSQKYGIETNIVRIFSVYGPFSPHYSIVHKIINQIINNKKIILGNTESKRDFLYVDDFLSAIALLINKKFDGHSKFNLGSGQSISINQLCTKILEISHSNCIVESDSNLYRNTDVSELKCNNDKLLNYGWSPQTTINDGLKKTFEWFQQSKNNRKFD